MRRSLPIIPVVVVLSLVLSALGTAMAAGNPVPVFAPPAALTTSLVGYWTLDETSGTRDDSAGSNPLASNNSVGSAAAIRGNGATFNGTNQWLSHANDAALQMGNIDFTVAAWVKLNSTSVAGAIIGKNDANNSHAEYDLHYGASGVNRFEFGVSSDGTITNTTIVRANAFGAPAVGVWYLVVAWHDATNDQIGISVDAGTPTFATHTGGVHVDTTSFWLGQRQIQDIFLNGTLDEVGVWKRMLTSAEIVDLYNGGFGCTYPLTTCGDLSGPTPTPYANPNLLRDGSFETLSNSPWQYLSTSRAIDMRSGGDFDNIGLAFCYNRYAQVRDGIYQRFWFPGGTMYASLELRSRYSVAYPKITVTDDLGRTGMDLPIWPAGAPLDGAPGAWERVNTFNPRSPGWYTLRIEEVDPLGENSNSAEWAYQVDDIVISTTGYYSQCGGVPGGPTDTPVPTATRTATPTRTSSPTPTSIGASTATRTPTATAAGVGSWTNCDFERGRQGWNGQSVTAMLAGGPVGPQWMHIPIGGSLSQPFNWSGGTIYLTFWLGPLSRGAIELWNAAGTGLVVTIYNGANALPAWKLVAITRNNVPAGTYQLRLRPVDSNGFDIDGVQPASNTYAYCGSPNGLPVTPTSGPTSFVTATSTQTPTAGPSPTRTPTRTPGATWTPNNTSTPSKTYTPVPTSTPNAAATSTQAAANATSTQSAGATQTALVGGNATEQAGATQTQAAGNATATQNANATATVQAAPTQMHNPPEQPAASCDSPCQRPDNPFNLAGWIEFTQCQASSYISWCQRHTDQAASVLSSFDAYEPFGTFRELREAVAEFNAIALSYDWSAMGLPGTTEEPLASTFTEPGESIWTGAPFELMAGGSFSAQCDSFTLASVVGSRLATSMCYIFNILHALHLMPWLQFFINAPSLGIIAIYVWKKFIDKAS